MRAPTLRPPWLRPACGGLTCTSLCPPQGVLAFGYGQPLEQPPHVGYTLFRFFSFATVCASASVYTGQDVFKYQIKLTGYATRQGYQIDCKVSSRNSALMHNDTGGPCFPSIFDNICIVIM
jgi:hypothetical protein